MKQKLPMQHAVHIYGTEHGGKNVIGIPWVLKDLEKKVI